MKLPRLSSNWFTFPETFRRYWDLVCNILDSINTSTGVLVSSLSTDPSIYKSLVRDANSITFGDIVVGGGSNIVPVYYDGTDWRIG